MNRLNSPLRYPGGKACLYDLTAKILRLNKLERGHYAEPYAGGCGLALTLLFGGHAADVHLNDIDRSVWAFWHCVLNETDKLIDLVQRTPVTIDEWLKQREIHRNSADTLELGFAAFFLNRTNRSGVIKDAGVIGGLAQTGEYKVDCRFNRNDLIKRIARVRKYRERVHLTNLDALDFLQHCEQHLPKHSLLFIDPPYFNKGASLYTNFYRPSDHANVARKVIGSALPWIVTYDDAPEIRALYMTRRQYCFNIKYSLNKKRLGTELLIASKALRMPEVVKDRQVNRPHYRAA